MTDIASVETGLVLETNAARKAREAKKELQELESFLRRRMSEGLAPSVAAMDWCNYVFPCPLDDDKLAVVEKLEREFAKRKAVANREARLSKFREAHGELLRETADQSREIASLNRRLRIAFTFLTVESIILIAIFMEACASP